jgi:hypothetical protein
MMTHLLGQGRMKREGAPEAGVGNGSGRFVTCVLPQRTSWGRERTGKAGSEMRLEECGVRPRLSRTGASGPQAGSGEGGGARRGEAQVVGVGPLLQSEDGG